MHESPPDDLNAVLEQSLRDAWDARVVGYDHERFPFAAWILDRIHEHGHGVDSLDRLHEGVPFEETYVLTKQLCADTNRPEFRALVNDFVTAEIAPKGRLEPPLAVQRFLNVRVMLPDTPQGVFPFHTGLLYGHGEASRSLWLPLTDVSAPEDRSASLQIIGLDRSRELVAEAIQNRMSITEMTDRFGAESHGIRAAPGQVLLFTQENVHGNFVNRTGRTRVSIDFRVAEARFGDRLARKIPGGYFELIGEAGAMQERPDHTPFANGRSNIIYLHNNTPGCEGAPAHLQRYMVLEYCREHDVPYDFELFELERMDHLPTLRHIVAELACNVLLYSIYALPRDPVVRRGIFADARRSGVHLCFVNEALVVGDASDEARVEDFLRFAKYGPAADGAADAF